MALSGCAIKGEIYEKTPHAYEPKDEIPSELTVVKSYVEIKNHLENIIGLGIDSTKLAVVDYWGDIEKDLKEIIGELTTEDPLGIYAVSSVAYEQAKASGYYQVNISVQHKKTSEEIRSIITVKSDEELENELIDMLSDFQSKKVFRVWKAYDVETLNEIVKKAYYSSPSSAVGLKNVSFGPLNEGSNGQIFEVSAEYLYTHDELFMKKQQIEQAGAEMCAEAENYTTDEKIAFIYDKISEIELDSEAMIVVTETGDTQHKTDTYSAYGAIFNKKSAQSGIAMTEKLMCDILEIPNRIIVGKKDGVPHIWLMIQRGESWQHFDATGGRENYIISSIDLAQHYEYNMEIYDFQ